MSTVVWSGTVVAQPVQGEMRRFIVKARIDARTPSTGNPGGTAAVYSDTNKICLIKAGWLVKEAFPRLIQNGSTYNACNLKDSGGTTYGPTFAVGGVNATINAICMGQTMLVQQIVTASFGKYYPSDDYLMASFGGDTTNNFDGIMDVFLDVIDTNPYTNPPASWSANSL